MRRILARAVFVTLMASVAAALGTLTALVISRPGKDLLARLVSEESNRLVRGSVVIGRISGDFVSELTLDSVVVRDTSGALLADVGQLRLRYGLASLLAKRFVFDSVTAVDPRIEITKHRGGRMNYQEVLRLGEGTGTGSTPLLRLANLVVERGRITIRTPWNPDGRLGNARQQDSALRAERAKPGRRIEPGALGPDGLVLVRVVDQLTMRLPSVLLSSPEHTPFTAVIDSLTARVSDPMVTIADLNGKIVQGADSLVFELTRAALPHSLLRGAGRLDWPRDTVLYRFELTASALDLTDLRWISPDFPAFAGTGRVRATSIAGSRTEFDLKNLRLGDRTSRVDGNLVAILDVYRGLGVRNLALNLGNFDLEVVRPYLDTLPFRGRLSGSLHASGFFDAMNIDADWTFRDGDVSGAPESRLALVGDMTLGGPNGTSFHAARLTRSDFDLGTIRRVAPAVALDGRLSLVGVLDGPWRDLVYQGRVEHRNGSGPLSAATGRVRLDTRAAILGLDADLAIDTLDFDGIRPNFPQIALLGRLTGPLKLTGNLERLRVDGDLSGAIGHYRVKGVTTLQPPRWGADSLTIDFERADLSALGGNGPRTNLAGSVLVHGRLDTLAAPEADVTLRLRSGTIRELAIDSGRARIRIHDSLIVVDTAALRWQGGGAYARGALGWASSHQGTLGFEGVALSLAPFDSLAATLLSLKRGPIEEEDRLGGRGRVSGSVVGSLDHWRLAGTARADSAVWLDARLRLGTAAVSLTGGRQEGVAFDAKIGADSLVRKSLVVASLEGKFAGSPDRFGWSFGGRAGSGVALAGRGSWAGTAPAPRMLRLDSLTATVADRTWRLTRPAQLRIDSVATADTVVIETDDGSSLIRFEGEFPGRAPGRMSVTALGIALPDLYALAQRDTSGLAGTVALDARVGGTLSAPTFRGSASITGPVIGDLRAPTVRAVFNYQENRLQSNLTFWRTGRPVLDLDAELPLNLAVTGSGNRQLPGVLSIRGRADSVDLAVIEALTPNLRRVTGTFAVDAQVGGSWQEPRLGGWVEIRDGGAFVPGLGVTYRPLAGRLRFQGDSLVADSLRIGSGTGDAIVSGAVRLEQLTHPVLDLELLARDFLLIDVSDYLTLRARGKVTLTGPIERPNLSGQALATNSVVYFADLLSKDIVNLEDPLNVDLVDTTALRAQKLGARFQSRFLDSLTIRDLRFRIGEDVWLRSNEANVALEGQVLVNKERRRARRSEYRVSGEFVTPRGTYTLKMGPVFRTFAVEQGSVRYFNTPDLNASLDLSARYVVRTAGSGSDDYPIIARVTGTLLVPKLTLTSEPGRTPLPERDLVSLLVAGTTFGALSAQGAGRSVDAVASLASSILSSELQRSLISDVGLSLDLVEIRPGLIQSNGLFATGGVTTLAFGRQLSSRIFATFNLGTCLKTGDYLNGRYLGATLEYRLHRSLKLQVAAEPAQSCLTQVTSSLFAPSRQFGADLKWDREY